MNPIQTVLEFMDRINQRNVDKLVELMTEDHVFVDSLGNQIRGREKMRAGWRGYYGMCPDYWVSHEEIFEKGNTVAIVGVAGGTIRESKWRTPAAWLAVVDNGLVKEWRVYADNKPVYDILARQVGHWGSCGDCGRLPPAACRLRHAVAQLFKRSVWQTRAARLEPRAPARLDPSV